MFWSTVIVPFWSMQRSCGRLDASKIVKPIILNTWLSNGKILLKTKCKITLIRTLQYTFFIIICTCNVVIISLKSCIHNKKNYDLCITATLYKIKESMKDSLCPPSWAVVDRKKKWRRRVTVRNGTPAGRLPHQSPGVTSPLTWVHTEGSLADKYTDAQLF
jgi:hypothetical protein